MEAPAAHLRRWATAACRELGYPEPLEAFLTAVEQRLGPGVNQLLMRGLDARIIHQDGRYFRLAGLKPNKGPYKWFGESRTKVPRPFWEYFVQVAEYVRLYETIGTRGLRLDFEDRLMDLTLHRGSELLVYVEVKETLVGIESLLRAMPKYQDCKELPTSDRGNDPLRKARCVCTHRPLYFCGVGIGGRREFRVEYVDRMKFELVPDLIPWI